jgi:hypothetical protein
MFRSALVVEAATEPDIWIVAAPLLWQEDEFGMGCCEGELATRALDSPEHFSQWLASKGGPIGPL